MGPPEDGEDGDEAKVLQNTVGVVMLLHMGGSAMLVHSATCFLLLLDAVQVS